MRHSTESAENTIQSIAGALWIIFVDLEKINNLKKWYAVWLRNWLLCLLASCLSWELAFEGKAQTYITKVHEATTNHELLRNLSTRPMFSSNQRGNEALRVLRGTVWFHRKSISFKADTASQILAACRQVMQVL